MLNNYVLKVGLYCLTSLCENGKCDCEAKIPYPPDIYRSAGGNTFGCRIPRCSSSIKYFLRLPMKSVKQWHSCY